MRTETEIYNDGPEDKDREGAIHELSNDETLCSRKLQNEAGNEEQNVDKCEELPSRVDHVVKKRRHDGSTECLFDRLPEHILHDILSRLSIFHLMIAARTCVAWTRIVSSCKLFQQLYDQKNQESWIARCRPPNNFNGHCSFFNIDSQRWFSMPQSKAWLLQGAADGLMLYVSKEGKLAVANPITRQMRVLPDTKVTSRLRLDLCLKKRLWSSKTTTPHIHLSLHSTVDQKTFKVMVWGELRTSQIHLLVYSSATDTWSTKLCPEVDYRLVKSPIFFTVDGNTIYFASPYRSPSVVASYNTDTGFLGVNQPAILPLRPWFLRNWVKIIGIMAYRSQILLLTVIRNAAHITGHPSLELWQGNPTGGEWQIFTEKQLTCPSWEIVAAYDGNSSVTIIQCMKFVMTLNLDSKEWKITSSHPTSLGKYMLGDSVAWAYHMKFRLSTAL